MPEARDHYQSAKNQHALINYPVPLIFLIDFDLSQGTQ